MGGFGAQSMKHLGIDDYGSAADDAKTTEERLRQHRSKLELARGMNNQASAANLGGASGPIWLD